MTTTSLTEFIELVDRDEELHRLRDEVARQEAELEALTTERDNAVLAENGEYTALAEQYDLLRTELDNCQNDLHEALNQRDGARAKLDYGLGIAHARIEELEQELSHVAVAPLDNQVGELTAYLTALRGWNAELRLRHDELTEKNEGYATEARRQCDIANMLRENVVQVNRDANEAGERANKKYNAVLVELAAAKADRDRYKSKARRKILTPRFQFRVSDGVADIAFGLLILALIIGLAVAAIVSTS